MGSAERRGIFFCFISIIIVILFCLNVEGKTHTFFAHRNDLEKKQKNRQCREEKLMMIEMRE